MAELSGRTPIINYYSTMHSTLFYGEIIAVVLDYLHLINVIFTLFPLSDMIPNRTLTDDLTDKVSCLQSPIVLANRSICSVSKIMTFLLHNGA